MREIDRAAAREDRGDIDGIVEYLLDQTSSVLPGSVTLVTISEPVARWGSDDVNGELEVASNFAVPVGINSETADLQYRLRPGQTTPGGDFEYLRTVALQLGNLLRVHFNRCRERWLDDVDAAFMEVDLHAQQCLEKLTERLPNVFPPTRLLKSNSHQVVQLLLRRKTSDDKLRIIASTGTEIRTLVDVDDSVVGLVFETNRRAGQNVVFGNPNEPPLRDVYKGFYSNIKSELCLPLRAEGLPTFAALNFESPLEHAYSVREVKYLQWMAPRLMRIVDALRRQIDSDERARRGVTSAQTTYWEAVAKIMSHDLRQPAATIKLSLERIAKEMSRLTPAVHSYEPVAQFPTTYWEAAAKIMSHDLKQPAATIKLSLQRIAKEMGRLAPVVASSDSSLETPLIPTNIDGLIGQILEQIDKSADELNRQMSTLRDFEAQFTDYLSFGPRSVYGLAIDAARFARERVGNRHQGPPVDIQVLALPSDSATSQSAHADTSPLLKVFIYNSLENSVYWIRRGIADETLPSNHRGQVILTIEEVAASGPVPQLNRYLRLTIHDNGPGAPEQVVSAINSAAPRMVSLRDSGQGYALQAFKEFVEGADGLFRVRSEVGNGFTVEADLRASESPANRVTTANREEPK